MMCDMVGFYIELGCSPDYMYGNRTGCPRVFTCPAFYSDSQKCYYRGVAYDVGATILQSEIKNPCSRSCKCLRNYNELPHFECATVDCPYLPGFDNKDCILTYDSLDACCAASSICDTRTLSSLKTCELNDIIYREGESFEPLDRRKICLCWAQWDGGIDNPKNCRDVNCGLELYYQNKIAQKCAPIFHGKSIGCPIDFQCYSDLMKVKSNNETGTSEKCVFGHLSIPVGDDILHDSGRQRIGFVQFPIAPVRMLTKDDPGLEETTGATAR
ncbi:uncharacterized protein LOC113240394 [Hyposmocoma kahamanoa]|uniref:uncharacterized protein LOC113240394 n=1 Tax=Hyposmocoma kahamanoa TaxID=1477025 RepID=UPI000E6D5CBD|nr:uncharacterized protein LOC113240394 [Hyposmocoma kahamanoa]